MDKEELSLDLIIRIKDGSWESLRNMPRNHGIDVQHFRFEFRGTSVHQIENRRDEVIGTLKKNCFRANSDSFTETGKIFDEHLNGKNGKVTGAKIETDEISKFNAPFNNEERSFDPIIIIKDGNRESLRNMP